MNLPKQSRPVIRDVTGDPIRARVEGAQRDPPVPQLPGLGRCLELCRTRFPPGHGQDFCIENCWAVFG
jgi:hypothetical protein